MKERVWQQILRVMISVLALGDGVLHLSLDYILFRPRPRPTTGGASGTPLPSGGTPVPGRGGPPPGGFRNPLILPLNQLFVLNFVGEVVLVLLFWFSRRLVGARRWLVDVVMIGYAASTFVAWWIFGRPNPMGLGYLSKGIEIVLIIALIVDIWNIARQRASPSPAKAQA